MSTRVNHLAVFVSAIVFFVVSWIWYAIIFGKAYMAALAKMGVPASTSPMTGQLIGTFLLGWILAYVIGIALSMRADPNPVSRGVGFGIFTGLGIYGSMTLMGVVWGGLTVTLWAINTGFVVVAMAIVGAIIGAWSKRAVA